ncbi:putative deoxyribonuclease RhsA [Amantichitinum ursilacus]|uniref:Putative deoxyribonuclease RhsA n=1 Tax=Amantichitinum ursilacus TaxID=857265 RepID=A0A0N0XGL6_9NEIS|nr:putative deoxyribonuclease RhsA [Amantichitinum ursilacus]
MNIFGARLAWALLFLLFEGWPPPSIETHLWKIKYDGTGNTFVYNLRMPGQYRDKEISRSSNGYREYDPCLGRYIQSDPIGLGGGISTYGYVGNNPLVFIDPSAMARTTVDAAIEQAIRRGDVDELRALLDAAGSGEQNAVIQNAITG